ncbi:FGGY family carbohydrate kinase [Lactobacillus sp. ESL0679]|uniref:FGGY family carbohydrate kinase n=1 Tax=Lactobacillus sp. ESL0679 TaxID=2983209 RepID=UPI0023F675A0|nr:FGGY family carbohydrate kinase [Lactobacillus sp. ESL0679]MDF7682701.1 FGGY family carbohydrate kinase [Lactobacillus sp. ESL0679]
MADKKFYLLIDIGTGSSRVCLMDNLGKVYDLQHISNEYQSDKNGGMLIDIPTFMRNLQTASKKVLSSFDNHISAITVSGARQTFFLTDENQKLLFGIPNIDSRGERFINDYVDNFIQIQNITTRSLSADFLAMKLVGLKHDRPELFAKVCSFTSLSEAFALLFCNKLVIEYSQAVETQLFDLHTKNWDKNLLDIFGLTNIRLPTIVKTGTKFKVTNIDMLESFGINRQSSCDFVIGGADTQLAMRAITDAQDTSTLCLVSGTTSPVCIRSKEASSDTNCWLDLDLGGDDYVLEYNPGVTGLNYEYARQVLLPETSYKEIEEDISLSSEQKILANLTTQSFRKSTGINGYGGWYMLPPLSKKITKKEIVGSVPLDIGFAISQKIKQLSKTVSNTKDTIVACGGGMNSQIIPQVVADITGRAVAIYSDFQEPSIIGCFNVANEAMGENNQNISRPLRFKYQPHKNEKLLRCYYQWQEIGNNTVVKK